MRHLLFIALFVFQAIQLFSQIRINEFSSSNNIGITDEDGDHSDWIELYNPSASEFDLNGFHVSDNKQFLAKWTLPSITLKPYSYLLIFASGKNRTDGPVSFQTIIPRGADWQYLVPTSDIDNSWQFNSFDASSWNTGPSGFGYGDNDDLTVLNNILSVFIRKEFIVTELQDVEELILSIDYDDGFVAYINGHEIARNNLGSPGSPVTYNQLTGSFMREATMYQGGVPENYFISNPVNYLNEGINVLAIQGHNSDPGSSDFSLIPVLTLGLRGAGYLNNHPSYIPRTGKQLHTSFKISSDGETLLLSRPDSSIIDSVPPVLLMADMSYGRKPDGESSWLYFSSPTPNESNSTEGFSTLPTDTVTFSSNGGYFPGGLSLQLSSTNSTDSIFYTLDGSEPSITDLIYTGPILVSGNSVIRARVINHLKLPGIISTNTYITKRHTLPVVCLSTDPYNLWDENTGIYVKGPGAAADYPFFGANFWQDWERTAHMELYDINGVKQIDQDIGIKIFGAWSRAFDQRSLALFARREYGKGSFKYKFFKDKPITQFESVILRNGGNDWTEAMVRDGLTSTLIRDMDIDRMAFQPSIVYINGEYWGIMNMREKVNTNYLAENHFVNPDNVNLLEFDGSVIDGSGIAYQQLKSFLSTHTLETESNYLQVSKKIDVNNYIQYQLAEIYLNNKDWPGNNIKFWNTNDAGSLWRWIIFDTDFGYSIWENSAYTFNTLNFALNPQGPDWPNPPWSTLLFRRMISNPEFRNEFANQYADRLNTNFTSEKVIETLDSIKQIYLPEINDHLIRWGLSYDNWQNNYSIINNYARYRPNYARMHIRSELGMGTALSIKVIIDFPGTGRVRINSITPDNYPFTGIYFKDLPIKLNAIPAPGYKFLRWEIGNIKSDSPIFDYNMAAPATFKAVFGPGVNSDLKIVINEINYKASPDKDTKDWIELYNAGTSSVNLKNWIISDGAADQGYTFSSDIILSPGMYIVICRDLAAFSNIKPNILNATGDMSFGLSSSGDDINLFNSDGKLIDYVTFSPDSPWPTDANGTGATIELINPLADNNLGKNWKSSPAGGTPGSVNFRSDTSVNSDDSNASGFTLSCFPNPFNDYTSIRIEVFARGRYKIEVYNLQGKLLNILSEQDLEPGAYYIDWDGKNANNEVMQGGIYIIRMTGLNKSKNIKAIYIK